MSISIDILDSCLSTNAELALRPDAPHGYVLATRAQTAGRGQRGNSWEAEPGKNLTFSMLLRPRGMGASRQFELSMLVALAVADTVTEILATLGSRHRQARVKWPNDIYIGHRKVAGILIENTLNGSGIERSIVGIGLNVNQTVFVSDAPNPTSLALETRTQFPTDSLLETLAGRLLDYTDRYLASPDPEALRGAYISSLYPGDGAAATYAEPGGAPFEATILDISPDGRMHLSNGRSYYFKEVALIPPPAL